MARTSKIGKGAKPVRALGRIGLRAVRGQWMTPSVAVDLARAWRQGRVFRLCGQEAGERELLVLSLEDDFIFRNKTEAFLAAALRRKGWRVRVVMRDRATVLGRAYFRAFGLSDFLYLSDSPLGRSLRRECEEWAASALDHARTVADIKELRYRGAWVGPQVLATLSRTLFAGRIDLSDPAMSERLRVVLRRTAEQVVSAEGILARCSPALGLTNEANYSVYGPLVDKCIEAGAPVVQFIQPWRDDAFIFKRLTRDTRRSHPASVEASTLERFLSGTWTARHERKLREIFAERYGGKWYLQGRNYPGGCRQMDRRQLEDEYGLRRGKKLAVVFSHVLWDANLFYGEDLFEDYGEWFVETVKAACRNTAVNWLVKIHPANLWKRAYEKVGGDYAEVELIRRHVGCLPDHVRLIMPEDSVCARALFESADFAITVRGTAGMEMACFGKPCLTAGTGRYSGLGFTRDSSTREEYLDKLRHLADMGPMSEEEILRAKWHAYVSFDRRLWILRSGLCRFRYRKRGRSPLDHNFLLTVGSCRELESAEDLRRWSRWAASGEVDYVEEDVLA